MDRIKEERKTIIITTLLSLFPLILGLILWNRLPDQIAMHYDISGTADSYYSKPVAVWFNLIFPAVQLICAFGTMSDPKNSDKNDKVINLVMWIIPLIAAFTSIVIYGNALNMNIDVRVSMMILVGFVFIVIGNYLPKCRQNYTIGIKVPWTLNDQENWDKTHRFAGYVFVIGGILMFISAFIGNYYISIIGIIIISILPIGYSYLLYIGKKA